MKYFAVAALLFFVTLNISAVHSKTYHGRDLFKELERNDTLTNNQLQEPSIDETQIENQIIGKQLQEFDFKNEAMIKKTSHRSAYDIRNNFSIEAALNRKYERLLQAAPSCPNIVLNDTYQTTYNLSTFSIQPQLTLSCGLVGYSVRLATIVDAGVPMVQINGQPNLAQAFTYAQPNSIRVINWSLLNNNTFYNISVTMQVADILGSTVTISDSFFFIIGTSNIYFQSLGDKTYSFRDAIIFDYSTAIDPYQPVGAKLTSYWSCDSIFVGCNDLQLSYNYFNPIDRITYNRIVFNYKYQFNATISNTNARYIKSNIDTFYVTITPPEATEEPLSCLNFTLIFKNKTLPFYSSSHNVKEILFDNNNYTDIVITGPFLNLSQCVNLYGNRIQAISFTSFQNPSLFDDIHTYHFNLSGITIPKARIQAALVQSLSQSLTSYSYLYTSDTNMLIGYQYVKLTLRAGDQTLYAKIAQSFIQVDKDKMLYIDGGSSYDSKAQPNSTFTYQWSVEGFPNVVLPNSKILTLTPEQRTTFGINQPGRYYNYTLRVQVDSRSSFPTKVLVQVSPGLDPNSCVTVKLKDIDLEKIVTYTIWPLLLQAKVTKGTCAGLQMGALVWSCKDVSWQFWQLILNNNTIGMDRSDLQQLPKSKDIRMLVTQYYKINEIEYMAVFNFTLFVERPDLLPIINYPQVFNPKEKTNLILDANNSYDPQAIAMNTTSVPILCKWECPSAFIDICANSNTTRSSNGCVLNILSATIRSSANYNYSISGQMYLFKLTITKDSRASVASIFVTIVDSMSYPKCSLSVNGTLKDSINQNQVMIANCNNTLTRTPSQFSYLWSLYIWDTLQYIPEAQDFITDAAQLRIPPYILGAYKEILVTLMVTADNVYSTPIGMYYKANDQSYFKRGSINLNFNIFTSYLSNFVMTPQDWDSALSSQLNFQLRIQEREKVFRVLTSPQEASKLIALSTILPPLTFEQAIYIDIIDSLGNYVTVRQPIQSTTDIKLTATAFAIKINAIVQTITYSFKELELEQNIYKLRMYFSAYQNDQIDTEGMSPAFFRILGESTIQYLYNTFVLDKRLSQVLSSDRRAIISQHIIDIIYSITKKHRNTVLANNIQQALILVNQLVAPGSNYTIGNSIRDVSNKLYQIAFNTFDMNQNLQLGTTGTGNIFEQILKQVLQNMANYMTPGEKLASSFDGFDFQVSELTSSIATMLDLSTFQYSTAEVFGTMSNPSGAMMVLIKNDTFAFAQVYDKNLNTLNVAKLVKPVNITFKMPEDIRRRYINGTIKLQCASRDGFSQSWTFNRINMSQVNNDTGNVNCLATHFTQYTMYIINQDPVITPVDNTTTVDPTKLTNKTGTDIVVDGRWNESQPNGTVVNNQTEHIHSFVKPIFQEQPLVMYLIAIGVLVLFLFTHFFFRINYKAEHNEFPSKILKHEYVYKRNRSRCRNYCRLFGLILMNFNPYLNLFSVYNKFLPRWVRNMMLQIYFMTVAIGFSINQSLLSLNLNEIFSSDTMLIPLFFIVMVGIIILRPLTIKVIYSLLYEPYSRVEDYRDNTTAGEMSKIPTLPLQQNNNSFIYNQDTIQRHISEQIPKPVLKDYANENERQKVEEYLSNGAQDPIRSKSHSMQMSFQGANNESLMRRSVRDSLDAGRRMNVIPESIGENNQTSNLKNGSFLPMIFSGPKGIPPPGLNPGGMDTMPSLGGRLKNIKEITSAFDEIDFDKDVVPKASEAPIIIAEEGELDRSHDSDEMNFDSKKKKEYNSYAWKRPIGSQPAKKKKGLLKLKKNAVQEENSTTGLQTSDNQQSTMQAMIFNNSPDEQAMPSEPSGLPSLIPGKEETSMRSSVNRKSLQGRGYMQFYMQQAQDDSSENKEDSEDFNQQQFEGGSSTIDQEEEKKNPQDRQHIKILDDGPLDRGELESLGDDENFKNGKPNLPMQAIESPVTDIVSLNPFNNLQEPSSNEDRLRTFSPKEKSKSFIDNIVEQKMNLTNGSNPDQNQNPYEHKTVFINKLIGRLLIVLVWAGLMVANMFCLIKMTQRCFIHWVILSCSAYFALVFIVDTFIYMVLACLMLKRQAGQTLTTNEKNNDNCVEYFTKKRQDKNARSCCSELFVVMIIGREKMKDLRRRLNPHSPI